MFWQLWSSVLSHGWVPNGLPWSPGWHVCPTCLQLCLSLCKAGIKCKSMQARMTGERGNIFPGSQIRFLFYTSVTECKLLSCTPYYTCALTFLPVKRKIAQLKGTFSLLDLPSRSHFGNLYLPGALRRWTSGSKTPARPREKNFSFQRERRIRSLTY